MISLYILQQIKCSQIENDFLFILNLIKMILSLLFTLRFLLSFFLSDKQLPSNQINPPLLFDFSFLLLLLILFFICFGAFLLLKTQFDAHRHTNVKSCTQKCSNAHTRTKSQVHLRV